jgi:hypothetical protein
MRAKEVFWRVRLPGLEGRQPNSGHSRRGTRPIVARRALNAVRDPLASAAGCVSGG